LGGHPGAREARRRLDLVRGRLGLGIGVVDLGRLVRQRDDRVDGRLPVRVVGDVGGGFGGRRDDLARRCLRAAIIVAAQRRLDARGRLGRTMRGLEPRERASLLPAVVEDHADDQENPGDDEADLERAHRKPDRERRRGAKPPSSRPVIREL
jgi:hypothetical protein